MLTRRSFSATLVSMLKIRLQRVGKKHEPVFRVVVTDSHAGPKAGKAVEVVGLHDPRFDKTDLKAERITHWIGMGAQVSPTVHNILVDKKIVEGKKVNVLPKKTPLKKEEEVKEEAPVSTPKDAEPETQSDENVQEETVVEEAKEESPVEAPAEEKADEAKTSEDTSSPEEGPEKTEA